MLFYNQASVDDNFYLFGITNTLLQLLLSSQQFHVNLSLLIYLLVKEGFKFSQPRVH